MLFPSVLSTFNRPSPTDRLNSPSHSALHNTVSSAVGQIEAVIGLSTSSAVGTLMYDVRSPDSNGGGHVQSVNKGGTGQTSYTKGDILVASSASVLNKLAAGSDGNVLTYDSTTATGLRWGGTRNAVSQFTNSGIPTFTLGDALFSSSIIGYTGLNKVVFPQTVGKISFYNGNIALNGNYKLGIYTEDGQTQVVNATISSITANAVNSVSVSSILFAAGNYWSVVVPISGNGNFTSWVPVVTLSYIAGSVAGKYQYQGTQPVTGGTLPTTFNPSIITVQDRNALIMRFDS